MGSNKSELPRLWTWLRPYLLPEVILAGLTFAMIAVFHGVAFDDRVLLNLFFTLIAVAVFALLKRDAIGLVLLVVSAVAALTLAKVYSAARPGTGDQVLNTASDVCFWVVFAFLGLYTAVSTRRFRGRPQRSEVRDGGQRRAVTARAAALTVAVQRLRRPISDILAVVETLHDKAPGPPDDLPRDSLADIEAAARQLAGLADDVLDHARAESAAVKLSQETVALPELINHCIAAVEPTVSEDAITVTAQVDAGVREIVADPLRLKQILLNLLSNGIQLSQGEGSVRLQVRADNKDVVITVRDTGKGIGEEEMKHLFSPYRQTADATTGFRWRLRLSIVRHLVELHGGTIAADSVPGSGSVFTVRLPKDGCGDRVAVPSWSNADMELETSLPATPAAPLAATAESTAQAMESLARETAKVKALETADEGSDVIRVLVADENATVRKILRTMLTSLGWEMLEATDGHQVLERAGKRPLPHAIVLDLKLPGISGYEVCRALKSSDQLRLIPVVVTTFSESGEEKLRALEAGADDLLSKPINRTELTVRLRALLRMHKFNQELIGAESVALALAHAVAAKDGYASSHLEKVAAQAVALGEAMGMDAAELKTLKFGALLHNVGKIAIPDAVLEKTGPLSPREKAMFQQHPRVGCDICAPLKPLQPMLPIVRHHKECWDGSGYPDGLRGDEIPLGAQIVGIADVYVALTSDRPYRKAIPRDRAIAALREGCREGQHNPELVEKFIALLEDADNPTAAEQPALAQPSDAVAPPEVQGQEVDQTSEVAQ